MTRRLSQAKNKMPFQPFPSDFVHTVALYPSFHALPVQLGSLSLPSLPLLDSDSSLRVSPSGDILQVTPIAREHFLPHAIPIFS